jgi:enediyne polyketide synthase
VPQRAGSETGAPIELIRRLVAERAELPASAVRDESRMLSDLHLNSITVGQLVSEAETARSAAHRRTDGFCECKRG